MKSNNNLQVNPGELAPDQLKNTSSIVSISSLSGKVICVPVALPSSTSANTPAVRGKPQILTADRILMDPGHKARKNPSDNADLGFQAVGPALRIMQLNVEGL